MRSCGSVYTVSGVEGCPMSQEFQGFRASNVSFTIWSDSKKWLLVQTQNFLCSPGIPGPTQALWQMYLDLISNKVTIKYSVFKRSRVLKREFIYDYKISENIQWSMEFTWGSKEHTSSCLRTTDMFDRWVAIICTQIQRMNLKFSLSVFIEASKECYQAVSSTEIQLTTVFKACGSHWHYGR